MDIMGRSYCLGDAKSSLMDGPFLDISLCDRNFKYSTWARGASMVARRLACTDAHLLVLEWLDTKAVDTR